MSNTQWANYMLEGIFEVWFRVYGEAIRMYPHLYGKDFVHFASNVLAVVKKKVRVE